MSTRSAHEKRPIAADEHSAQPHRTIDRVTKILEQVAYQPGMTLAELNRVLNAPKASVRGFVKGLVAAGWLYEVDHLYFLGPATHAMTLSLGDVRAGMVTQADLEALHRESGTAVFLGAHNGDHLIYTAEAGSSNLPNTDFTAVRMKFRWPLLATAGGKALLAALPNPEVHDYLNRREPHEEALVQTFLNEWEAIKETRIAHNPNPAGTRYAIASTVRNQAGSVVASLTMVGRADDVRPRSTELSEVLFRHIHLWATRVPPLSEPS